MQRGLLSLGLSLVLTSLVGTSVFAYSLPGKPAGYINDFAHVLSAETKQSLEAELAAFEATTSNQIAVAVIPRMDGDYVENYAVHLFKDWGIGTKQNNNGVLLLISLEERKMRIEVGYGLEGSLPDSVAQQILHNDIAPLLKQKNYDGAVAAGVHAIEQATRGEYKGTGTLPQIGDIGNLIANNIWTIIVVGLLLFQWLGAILGRSKSWWAGGIIGATGGLGIGWILSLGLIITLPIVITLAIFGLIFDFLVSSAYGSARLHGSTPPWWAGGSSGGGFGSSSSGGFGGFGGGGSGGGGASGGW